LSWLTTDIIGMLAEWLSGDYCFWSHDDYENQVTFPSESLIDDELREIRQQAIHGSISARAVRRREYA
jgi:hypothetical protein